VNWKPPFAQHGSDGARGGKPRGIKHEVAAYKRKMRTIYTLITFLLIVCVFIAVSVYFEGFFAGPELPTESTVADSSKGMGGSVRNNVPRAAVIDTLSNASLGGEFDDSVNRTLHEAGFGVDVYQGGQVTVDFLEKFSGGYKLVIFRVHSALAAKNELYIFTAEPYSSQKHLAEQSFLLVKEAYATESSQPVFAVNWGFVKRLMTGEFNGTLVVVMGCDGALDPLLSQEFVNQGAVGYIGWNGPVLLDHSDKAVQHFVDDLYVSKQPLKEAVNDTNTRVGPDPASGSLLECYVP
jgi:hypothetical protein